MTPHDDHPRDDVAAYALGALTDAQARELERHLAACDVCTAELARMRAVVDTLPAAAPPLRAPADLKRSVMKAVRDDAKQRHAAASRAAWMRPRRPALALAAGLAAAALAIGAYGLGAAGGERRVTAAVDGSRLAGASASLVVDGDVGVLEADDLPRAQGVYVVWVDRGQGPVYSSSFNAQPDGDAQAGIADLDGVERVMVTREASTAVTAPTEPPVVTVELS